MWKSSPRDFQYCWSPSRSHGESKEKWQDKATPEWRILRTDGTALRKHVTMAPGILTSQMAAMDSRHSHRRSLQWDSSKRSELQGWLPRSQGQATLKEPWPEAPHQGDHPWKSHWTDVPWRRRTWRPSRWVDPASNHRAVMHSSSVNTGSLQEEESGSSRWST